MARFQQALVESCLRPEALPPGAQDPFAETAATVAKPPPGTNPVVLVHGTWANRYNTFKVLSQELKNANFAVFALNFGCKDASLPPVIKGYCDIKESAKELALFVDEVLRKTGAQKVDLVGHSQGGGIMPRWYLKYEGGKDKVDKLIGLAPSNHGTTMMAMQTLGTAITTYLRVQNVACQTTNLMVGKAALQQSRDSMASIQAELDDGGDTLEGVSYVCISTKHDEAVTPWTQCALNGVSGHRFTNITLQDIEGLKLDLTMHLGIPNHPVVIEIVKRALRGETVDAKTLKISHLLPIITP
ncbi:alpha/beta fold hydrolase [Pendulispora brunnea]|uniref:Alpha/beta fold hydrolase n=1 Tax=Pendulispora brunnea TaxID=2905690 RepID=A0ABZ2KA03_9BACT